MELIKKIDGNEFVLVEKNNYHDMVRFIQTVCRLHKEKKIWDKSLDSICDKWTKEVPDATQ